MGRQWGSNGDWSSAGLRGSIGRRFPVLPPLDTVRLLCDAVLHPRTQTHARTTSHFAPLSLRFLALQAVTQSPRIATQSDPSRGVAAGACRGPCSEMRPRFAHVGTRAMSSSSAVPRSNVAWRAIGGPPKIRSPTIVLAPTDPGRADGGLTPAADDENQLELHLPRAGNQGGSTGRMRR